jgi:mono/diheme cytochrome c family protein
MLIALSTGHQIGLAVTAAIFIAFSLVSSFVLPNRSPNFPGRNRNAYVAVCVLLFLAMMAAVLVFGKEEEEAGAEGETPTTQTQTGETQTGETTTGESTTGEVATGDVAAGKVVFETKGCGACHTLKAAGTSGTVGPNLDEAKPELALIEDRVENGKGAMPPFKDQLDEKQIDDVAAFVDQSVHAS